MKWFSIGHFNDSYINGNGKLLLTLGIGLGVAGYLLHINRRRIANMPPKKWLKVGEISEIICYPIKSCGPIRLTQIQCNTLGLTQENGHLRDRVFMLIDKDRNFVTARTYPQLLQVQPQIDHEKIMLTAPNMPNIEIFFSQLYSDLALSESATIYQQSVRVVDCGDAIAKWFSQYTDQKDDCLRLVFYPDTVPSRDCVKRSQKYKKNITLDDAGSLQDETSYMLMNQASVDDLNTRLDHLVTPLQFRPNFVVKGVKPFAEDNWIWIRIGDKATFRSVRPCTRCILTNIDPVTSKRNPSFEPVKTLKSYRNLIPNDSPVLGIHLGLRSVGTVSIGDHIYIGDTDF